MKQPLISRIKEHLKSQGRQLHLFEIYEAFPQEKPTTIRGRIYESVGKGINKVEKGLYISSDVIVEHADIMERIKELKSEGREYDFIFLDIPYMAGGQKGGNRDLSTFGMITPEQFGSFISECEKLLKTDKSPNRLYVHFREIFQRSTR